MVNLSPKNRSLTTAKDKRKYDLPLNKDNGGLFLKILVALMCILAIFALSSSFALSHISDRWSSGLENKATVEIPTEDKFGKLIPQEIMEKTAKSVMVSLNSNTNIDTVQRMSAEEVKTLVTPWLGENITFDNVTLPEIITITFKTKNNINPKLLESRLKNYGEHIRLDTHESWLNNLLKLTGALNFSALFLSLLIGITTIVAVTGAIQSRMAVYHEELELLHLMGASDTYISNQLQRYSFITCLQGAASGTAIGLICLLLISFILKQQDVALIPNLTISTGQIIILLALPLFIAILGMLTAKYTVLRILTKMP
jgi:cell division transport system permease protein